MRLSVSAFVQNLPVLCEDHLDLQRPSNRHTLPFGKFARDTFSISPGDRLEYIC